MENNQNNAPNPQGGQEGAPAPVEPPMARGGAPTNPVAVQAPNEPPVAPAPTPIEEQDWGDASTGNEVLDTSVRTLVQSMGSTPKEFISMVQNAVEYGDVNLIDHTLVDSKYAPYKSAIEQVTKAIIESTQQSEATVIKTVEDVAGGMDNWKASVAIFNAQAPTYLKETVKTMIDNGLVKEGAQMLMQSVQSLGSTGERMPGIQGTTSTPQRGLSYDEMKKELSALISEAGGASLEGDNQYARRYASIQERRALGRKQGL